MKLKFRRKVAYESYPLEVEVTPGRKVILSLRGDASGYKMPAKYKEGIFYMQENERFNIGGQLFSKISCPPRLHEKIEEYIRIKRC